MKYIFCVIFLMLLFVPGCASRNTDFSEGYVDDGVTTRNVVSSPYKDNLPYQLSFPFIYVINYFSCVAKIDSMFLKMLNPSLNNWGIAIIYVPMGFVYSPFAAFYYSYTNTMNGKIMFDLSLDEDRLE